MIQTVTNNQWRLKAQAAGPPRPDHFQWVEQPLAAAEGGVLVRTIYLSIDPSTRLRIAERPSYSAPLQPGAVVPGRAIGLVERSDHPAFPEGSLVLGDLGWQRYALSDGAGLTRLPNNPELPLTAAFALLGHTGLTAYVGVFDIGRPRPGETLVVSAAAGAVGSIAGQLGKIAGCRVVGLARGAEKCRWLTAELGFDAAVDISAEPPSAGLQRCCPDGIDVVFENVGGACLDAALAQINVGARVALCGLIGQYNAEGPVPGPYNFANVLTRRARVEGFLNFDHQERAAACMADLSRWLKEGRLRYRVEVMDGLDQAPHALERLFGGSHLGKLVVQVSPEPRVEGDGR